MNDTGLRAQLFRRKPAAALMAEAESHSGGLKRALGALDLTLLGIGAIVGAGIFVLTGVAAAEIRRPRDRAVVHRVGIRMRDGRAVLRGVRRDDSGGWQRVFIFLRDDG